MKILNSLFYEDKNKGVDLYNKIYDKLGESVLPLIHHSYMNWEKCINPDNVTLKINNKNDRFMAENNYYI